MSVCLCQRCEDQKCLSVFMLALLGWRFLLVALDSHCFAVERSQEPSVWATSTLFVVDIQKYTNFLYLFAFNNIYALVCTWPDPYFIFCKLPFTHRFDLLLFHLLLTFFSLIPTDGIISLQHCCGYRCSFVNVQLDFVSHLTKAFAINLCFQPILFCHTIVLFALYN